MWSSRYTRWRETCGGHAGEHCGVCGRYVGGGQGGRHEGLHAETAAGVEDICLGGGGRSTPVTLCGMEICEKEGGFWLGQSAYIRDLVGRYPEVKSFDAPAAKVELPEEEEGDRTADEVREAQVALGELLWVSTRTSPDVAFAVGQASRMVARTPKQALRAAKQILGSLKETDKVGIIYKKEMKPREGEAEFPGAQEMGTLEIQADVSFAPEKNGLPGTSDALTVMMLMAAALSPKMISFFTSNISTNDDTASPIAVACT